MAAGTFEKDFRLLLKAAKEATIQLLPVLWSFHALVATAYTGNADGQRRRTKNQGIAGSHVGLFEAGLDSLSRACADNFVAAILKPLVAMCVSFPVAHNFLRLHLDLSTYDGQAGKSNPLQTGAAIVRFRVCSIG